MIGGRRLLSSAHVLVVTGQSPWAPCRLFLSRADPSIFGRPMYQFRLHSQSPPLFPVRRPMSPLHLLNLFPLAALSLSHDLRCDATRYQRCAALESVRDRRAACRPLDQGQTVVARGRTVHDSFTHATVALPTAETTSSPPRKLRPPCAPLIVACPTAHLPAAHCRS